jgi:hypothetical protein
LQSIAPEGLVAERIEAKGTFAFFDQPARVVAGQIVEVLYGRAFQCALNRYSSLRRRLGEGRPCDK